MLKLYGHAVSGNAYKVKLLLSLLGLQHEEISVNLMKGEHRQPAFLALNPFGQVPVLTDGDIVLADAQAILVYLARQYGVGSAAAWLPLAPLTMAKVMRWLSTAAGEVRQGPEIARLYHLFGSSTINIEQASKQATFILDQLNQHLSERDWLAGNSPQERLRQRAAFPTENHPTIADIAVFPYVALAPDGKISLDPYPHVLAWIERIKQLPGFVGMAGID